MTQLGDGGVQVPRQFVHAPVQVALDRGEPRFGALEARLRRSGGGDADFGQALGLRAELPRRLFVQMAQRRPFLLDDALERLKSRRRIALQSRFDVVPSREPRLELADRHARGALRSPSTASGRPRTDR